MEISLIQYGIIFLFYWEIIKINRNLKKIAELHYYIEPFRKIELAIYELYT